MQRRENRRHDHDRRRFPRYYVSSRLTLAIEDETLKESIGQGYVETDLSAPGTKIFVHVRGRDIPAVVTLMPFIPAKTKSMKKKEEKKYG